MTSPANDKVEEAAGRTNSSSREARVRSWLALILVLLLCLVVMSFIVVWAVLPTPESKQAAGNFFPVVISSLTGLVGAVIGYYFRQSEGK
ncbi:MAG: hypothetical protein EXR54_03550 [Dehalococcoidia bacterium]|nr:hypothetical protein [Dehalococcoidia bacterium]MSQ16629.1 hypothetical protein [Dehalococcoidia bacterium]